MIGRHLFVAAMLLTCVASLAHDAAAADSNPDSISSAMEEGVWASISDGSDSGPAACDDLMDCCQRCRSGWFGAVDYRLVRTHFREAVAFATLTAAHGT